MSKKSPAGAEARLEDLDVREVSVVDRPAIQRRFLIVKTEDGVSVLVEEDDMPRAIPAADARAHGYVPDPDLEGIDKDEDGTVDIIDLLVGGDEGDDDEEPEEDDDVSPEPITKAKAGAVASAAAGWVGKLSGIVGKLKKVDKEVPGAITSSLSALAATIAEFVEKAGGKGDEGDDKAEAKKGASAILGVANKALSALVGIANKTKGMDKSADVPGAVLSSLGAVAASLEKAAGAGGDSDDKDDKATDDKDKGGKPEKAKKRLQIFVDSSNADNPEIIFKAGARMKRARLNQLRKVVTTLQSLLKELEGGEAVGKAADAIDARFNAFEERITKQLDAFGEAITKSGGDDAGDEARPAGAGDDDPDAQTVAEAQQVAKNKAGIWGNVLGPIIRS